MGVSGDPKYSNEALQYNENGKSDFFETFDSGSGVLVPEGMEGDFAHQDGGAGLSGYTLNKIDMGTVHGGVPEVNSNKR